MVIDWQDSAAMIAVAGAAVWLARGIWRWLRRKAAAGCTSCSGCGGTGGPKLVEIQPPR
jgi:hypothetical protein